MNAMARDAALKFSPRAKPGVDWRRIFDSAFCMEISMTSFRTRTAVSRAAPAVTSIAALLWSSAALASQGPGGGMGTASHLTQTVMAVLVYGMSAIIVGAGLIVAVRRR
jgi:hypothetical protein